MAELQTVAAVCDLIKITIAAGAFLQKVKDADELAAGLCEQVGRLGTVLKGVEQVLKQQQLAHKTRRLIDNNDRNDEDIIADMLDAVDGCKSFLLRIQSDVGGFQDTGASKEFIENMVNRFKIAWKHPKILSQRNVLEARISTLQTGLAVLQLINEARIQSTIDTSHTILMRRLAQLESRIREQTHLRNGLTQSPTIPCVDDPSTIDLSEDETDVRTALASLSSCLRTAEEVHEVYTEYTSGTTPDCRSIRFHERVFSDLESLPADAVVTPAESRISLILEHSRSHQEESCLDQMASDTEEPWPCELLDQHILDYMDRASITKDAEQFNQAEFNLHRAIEDSELRERHYGITFTDRDKLQEEMAFLYAKQGKWAEAASTALRLANNSASGEHNDRADVETILARQHQLLGWIYFERHNSDLDHTSNGNPEYLQKAERYTRQAFNKRFTLLKSGVVTDVPGLTKAHEACMALLISILEQRGKTVEAMDLQRRLSDVPLSPREGSRRLSTTRPISHYTDDEIELVQDPFDSLIEAIVKREAVEVQALLAAGQIDVNRLSKSGKTPLMHAVEQSDEPAVRKILDPGVGGVVDFKNTNGATALHIASSKGLHAMVKCLFEHDADINAKDCRGDTPLVKAVQGGQSIVIEYLAGIDVDMLTKNTDEWSVLHHGVHQSRPDITDLVLGIAPDLRDAVDRAGKTALHYCVELEDLTQTRVQLEHNRTALDVNAGDEQERSPLYFAASKPYNARRNEMICLLLDHHATFIGTKFPPRWKDYPRLKTMKVPLSPKHDIRHQKLERHDSVSTSGTVGTMSTEHTKLSKIFSLKSRRYSP
nr:e3 ubiquitin-protein ligase mib2 [Quercus suber]